MRWLEAEPSSPPSPRGKTGLSYLTTGEVNQGGYEGKREVEKRRRVPGDPAKGYLGQQVQATIGEVDGRATLLIFADENSLK